MTASAAHDLNRESSPAAGQVLTTEPPALGDVEGRFRQSGYLALRDITCEVQGGVLSLRGRLSSFYLKQIAQAIAIEADGVRAVINEIEVITSTDLPDAIRDRRLLNEEWGV